MTYRALRRARRADGYRFEDWGAPQSYMMLDIAALQHLYGADFAVNAGDTVYRWTPGSGRTLVDGEVGDRPRRQPHLRDDLGRRRPGHLRPLGLRAPTSASTCGPARHSVFAERQLADLGGGPNGGHARGNIFNALQYRGRPRAR